MTGPVKGQSFVNGAIKTTGDSDSRSLIIKRVRLTFVILTISKTSSHDFNKFLMKFKLSSNDFL